jgi:hypothetical protein
MAVWEYITAETIDSFDKSAPSSTNPAVARCTKAWIKTFRAEMQEDDNETMATKRASEAFRAAMPPLSSRENCRDFIACVAHGTLLGAIPEKYGSKLLYAAQVALSSCGKEDSPKAAAARGTSSNSIQNPKEKP